MIGLGLRLAVGSRAARTRLVLVAIGVALGTVFLLGALGYMHARGVMNHRVATRTPQMTGGRSTSPGFCGRWRRSAIHRATPPTP